MTLSTFPTSLADIFSPFSVSENEDTVTLNCYKASLQGAFVFGVTALVSFIFNRFLAQEGASNALGPDFFTVSLYSWAVFVIFAACFGNKVTQNAGALDSN